MKKLALFLFLSAFLQPVFAQSFLPKFIRKMYFDKDTSKKAAL
jgi:hypothetical protein